MTEPTIGSVTIFVPVAVTAAERAALDRRVATAKAELMKNLKLSADQIKIVVGCASAN